MMKDMEGWERKQLYVLTFINKMKAKWFLKRNKTKEIMERFGFKERIDIQDDFGKEKSNTKYTIFYF